MSNQTGHDSEHMAYKYGMGVIALILGNAAHRGINQDRLSKGVGAALDHLKRNHPGATCPECVTMFRGSAHEVEKLVFEAYRDPAIQLKLAESGSAHLLAELLHRLRTMLPTEVTGACPA